MTGCVNLAFGDTKLCISGSWYSNNIWRGLAVASGSRVRVHLHYNLLLAEYASMLIIAHKSPKIM